MNALFIADAHLSDPGSYGYSLLMRLLERVAQRMDSLVILGDLFDLWIGDNKKLLDLHKPLIDVLRKLRKEGTEVFYLRGNHEIFMGEIFLKELEFKVFEDELVLEWDGYRIFASHGDRINKNDYGFRILRALLRSKLVEFLAVSIDDATVYRLAQWVSSHTGANPLRQNQQGMRTLFSSYARNLLQGNYHAVILGHSHIPHWEVLSQYESPKLYLNPGSWSDDKTYIWYQNGHFELRMIEERGEKILFDFPHITR